MRFLPRALFGLEIGARWIARLLTVFIVGVVLLIFIGQGFNPFKLTAVEAVQMVFFWTTCIGMVVAWRWEVLGGILATAGILLFYVTEFAVTGAFPKLLMVRLFLLPGFLFLLSGYLKQRLPSSASPTR
jgi:hypothetical protein